jgi:hypothetical protein
MTEIIKQTIEEIIKNNNTAQDYLEDILQKMVNKDITELIIHIPLYGNLDFSILQKEGYRKIKTIILKEGKLTAIVNLPANLEKLVCNNQKLMNLENLPDSLQHLECTVNYLQSIDLKDLNKLKVLKISYNKLKEIENLPSSLEELYIDNNEISIINLKETPNLRVLHTFNNRAIIIESLPPSVVDLKIDDNITQVNYNDIRVSKEGSIDDAEKTKIEYKDSLTEYFKLKNKYEENVFKLKKSAYNKSTVKRIARKFANEVNPRCIYCKRPVGSLFFHKDHSYYAICGDKINPCALNIQIYNGSYYQLEDVLYDEKRFLEDIKNEIIQQKLDTIFEYISTKKSAELFKKSMDDFNEFNRDYTELKENYDKTYKDTIRESLIHRKREQIFKIIESMKILLNEYERTNNHALLKTAIELQVNELNPEIANLRILKNEINEVGFDEDLNILHQRYTNLHKNENIIGEPKVVKFVV